MKTFKSGLRLAAVSAVALLAAGCAPEIETRLYMQDLLDALQAEAPLLVPATLRIPESSNDACLEELPVLVEQLTAITPLRDEGTCIEHDGSDFAVFTIDLPILHRGADTETDYLITVEIAEVEDGIGAGIALQLSLNQSVASVAEQLDREGSSPDDKTGYPQITIAIDNDSRDPIGVMPNYVFVDGLPALPGMESAVSLDRRASVEITFSDVVAGHVAQGRSALFATVYPGGA